MSAGVRLGRQPSVDTPSHEAINGTRTAKPIQPGSIPCRSNFAALEPAEETGGVLSPLVELVLAAAVGAATAGLMLLAHRFLLSRWARRRRARRPGDGRFGSADWRRSPRSSAYATCPANADEAGGRRCKRALQSDRRNRVARRPQSA